MPRDTVFFRLAKNENSFTELLCNLLMRDEFRERVLPVLAPEIAKLNGNLSIHTQESFECGRPDLIIKSADFLAFVEVKLNRTRGVTPYQQLENCDDLDLTTYLRYLQAQPNPRTRLVFLIPADWIHRIQLENDIAKISPEGGCQVGICEWEAVFAAVETDSDPITDEFKKLLRRQLGLVKLLPEEKQMIMTPGFVPSFTTSRKLHMLVDGALEKVNFTRHKASTADEYGAYIPVGKKSSLFFGLWNVDGQVHLCYALSSNENQKAAAAFQSFFGPHRIHTVADEKWAIFSIDPMFLQDDISVAAKEISNQLTALIQSVSGIKAA